ncbi:hypothetical protein BaRGS_00035407 [Batillaria attramentaria]|uniref:HTH psq-type domain-containing protein n=1 Tax=Batillaria attramentaria TaxID=370345 RepID=A0ABD0JEI3_9CAEN
MPRGQTERRGSHYPHTRYSEEEMTRAVDMVHRGVGVERAADLCAVPRRTLSRWLTKCKADHPRGRCHGAFLQSPVDGVSSEQNALQYYEYDFGGITGALSHSQATPGHVSDCAMHASESATLAGTSLLTEAQEYSQS